jgi:hypothetical protein
MVSAGGDVLTLRVMGRTARWVTGLCALTGVGAGLVAASGTAAPEWSAYAACSFAGAYVMGSMFLMRRLEAGPEGLRFRTRLRWRRLAWDEIDRFEERRVQPGDRRLSTHNLRAAAALRNGESVWLPVPYAGAQDAFGFEDDLRALRSLQRRYTPSTPGPPAGA